MSSEAPSKQARSLRQYFTQLELFEADPRPSREPRQAAPHEQLLAEVSAEARNIEYERWDGMA